MATAQVEQFIKKWTASELKERSASQEHFLDLCRLLNHQTPAEADPKGESFCFEIGASKLGGGEGWADVWKRGFFAWEYKGKKKDLTAAYLQLNQYREDLENPPCLIVCDTDRFEIHTNFTGTAKQVFSFSLPGLREPANLKVLEAVFKHPDRLRPHYTPEGVTQEAAERVASLDRSMESRGVAPRAAAHFLVQVIFCLFAEDVSILPKGLFSGLLAAARKKPSEFARLTSELFAAMREGGYFGVDEIAHFNGGLFANDAVVPLTEAEIGLLYEAARLDWSTVEPAIFGALFERSLDPTKRQQIGAHYTAPADILAILEPVVFAPLRVEWEASKSEALAHLERYGKATTKRTKQRAQQDALNAVDRFLGRLRTVRILDPACGSGNFLYLALRGLKDLEGEVIGWAALKELGTPIPFVSPMQLFGIEIEPYAHELAQVVVWIGHLQWSYHNAFASPDKPILRAFENIRCEDAVLSGSPGAPRPAWPAVDFIVGNPPFLGGKLLRSKLGDAYLDRLFAAYEGRVPREADLVCYWFERAREQVQNGHAKRIGLVATNSIRGGANRRVIERIKGTGDVFMGWADRPWVQDGADVRVSMIGFDDGSEKARTLDGIPVSAIHSDLTSELDLTKAKRLRENAGLAFMGDTKGGAFDIPGELARSWLDLPNPAGRSNRDVLRPWANGMDVTRRSRDMWIIDFGVGTSAGEAALFEKPFEYVKEHVKPDRDKNRREQYRQKWWIHVEPRPAMRAALDGLASCIVTPTVAKHRVFAVLPAAVLPDHQLIVFASADWFLFGVLHSRLHELWSLRMGSSLEDRPRYTPTSTFETFPMPLPTDAQRAAIGGAAKDLEETRASALAADGALTLTALYNKRPTWLAQRHEALDLAVAAAYAFDVGLPDDEQLRRLLALNIDRAKSEAESKS